MAMSPRAASRLAWSMAGAATVLALAGFGYAIAPWHVSLPPDIFGFRAFNTIIALEFAATGLIVALKRPANPIGWLLLTGAVVAGLNELTNGYAVWAVDGNGSTSTIARLAAVGEEWLWIVAFSMLAMVLVVFPDGHALSRRWRRVTTIGLAGITVSVVAFVFTDQPSVFRNVVNPLAVPGAAGLGNATLVFFLLILICALANLIIGFRRSTGDEHAQLKWVATATGFVVAAFAAYQLGVVLFGARFTDTSSAPCGRPSARCPAAS